MSIEKEKPTLLLLAPINFGFNNIIAKNIRKNGWVVYDITGDYFGEFRYSSLSEKLKNTFRKTFLNDKDYKNLLKTKRQISILNTKLKNEIFQKCDYALFIRPDLWDKEVVSEITQLATKSICYQWDGFTRYPKFKNYIPLFNKTFVFDQKDFDKTNPLLQLSTNFWFDVLDEYSNIPSNNKLLYVGTYDKQRMNLILRFLEFLKNKNIECDAFIFFDNKHDAFPFEEQTGIKILYEKLNYEDMIALERHYSTILDFQNPLHRGLSFRHFEALALNKKLITNNGDIKKYDFYNANNTFVLEEKNWDQAITFLQSNYIPISEKTKAKYTFSNWLHFIFEVSPYESLALNTFSNV